MSNMNNPAFKKLYNEILEKKLKDYAVKLEAELNSIPNIVKGLDIGNTVASAEASMIPSGGILESVHKSNSLLDKLSGLGSAIKKNAKGIGIATAMSGILATGGYLSSVLPSVLKHSSSIRAQNLKVLGELPLITSVYHAGAEKLNLGVTSNVTLKFGPESRRYARTIDNESDPSRGFYNPRDETLAVKDITDTTTIVHELSHANEQNWPMRNKNLSGFKGDYSGRDDVYSQIVEAFDESGYSAAVEKMVDGRGDARYWTSTDEMYSRLTEAMFQYKTYGPNDPKAVPLEAVYPTREMVAKLEPLFNQISHDSNIVRLSKEHPETFNKLNRNYVSIVVDNLIYRIRTGRLKNQEQVKIPTTPKRNILGSKAFNEKYEELLEHDLYQYQELKGYVGYRSSTGSEAFSNLLDPSNTHTRMIATNYFFKKNNPNKVTLTEAERNKTNAQISQFMEDLKNE